MLNICTVVYSYSCVQQTFQLFAVLLFLYVIGFINTASTDSRFVLFWGNDVYRPADSVLFRYAVIVIVYVIIGTHRSAPVTTLYNVNFDTYSRQHRTVPFMYCACSCS